MSKTRVAIVAGRERILLKRLSEELARNGAEVKTIMDPIIPAGQVFNQEEWIPVFEADVVLVIEFPGTLAHEISRFVQPYDVPVVEIGYATEDPASKIYQIGKAESLGIAIPDTLFLRSSDSYQERYQDVKKKLDVPFVLKKEYGSKGDDVHLVSDEETYRRFLADDNGAWIAQRYHAHTKDARVFILNGEVLQFFERHPRSGEFRTNTDKGGTINALSEEEIPQEIREQSLAIAKELNQTLAAVDWIRETDTDEYIFMESNASPGIPSGAQSGKIIGRIIKYITDKSL